MLSKSLYLKIRAKKWKRSYMLPRYLPRKTSLTGLQALSECDSTIVFHGIGRRKWLSIVKSDEKYCNALGVLRESLEIEDCLFDMIESMLCQACGFLNKPNVNDIQYEKCCGEKFPETSKLPGTKDELHQHVKRVNLQVSSETWLVICDCKKGKCNEQCNVSVKQMFAEVP